MMKSIRRKLIVLLCASMVMESVCPAAGLSTVYAASDITQDIAEDDLLNEDGDILDEAEGAGGVYDENSTAPEYDDASEDDGFGIYDDAVYGEDPDSMHPGSQNAEDYFTQEEIEAAEAFYHIDEEPEPEPTEAEIKAELEEKARLIEEEQKRQVDDSYKLAETYDDEEGDGDDEIARDGASEKVYNVQIGGATFSYTPRMMIKYAANSGQNIKLLTNIEVPKTLVVPSGKTVTIYLNGYDFNGYSLGGNPVFKLEDDSTLRIIGKENRGNRNRIINGGDGAIVCNTRSTLYLKDLWVERNKAGHNGGGIYLGEKVNCQLYNVGINANTAGSGGGGIYVAGTLTNISLDAKTEIINNTAGSGGGIYINKSKVNIYGPAFGKAKVANNKAKTGGGLYFNAEDIAAGGLLIDHNEATDGHGGGVRMQVTKTSLAGCDITNNTARGGYGGGVYINGKVGTMTDCTVMSNGVLNPSYVGGGIFVDSMDNINTGGKFIVTGNYRGDSNSSDDLFLQNGKTTDAYIHAANYAPGSKIGIGVTDWKEGQRITFAPGSFNPKVFYCNNSTAWRFGKLGVYYITLNNDSKSKNYRHLVITQSKVQANVPQDTKSISFTQKNQATAISGRSYVTLDGDSYPLYYGYVSSPSHTDEKKDIVNKYFYSDGYFFDDPKIYNTHLATFGMNLAMASADSNIGSHSDYTFKFDNVKSMLRGMGCAEEDIYISPSYIVKPTDSSIGVAIGKKTIKRNGDEYTLVPIAIRSYGYEKEWASNMTIDSDNTKGETNAEHSGFRDARTKVMNALNSYISTYGLESQLNQGRVKFFLVGFSRGSATANLTSKALVDTYGELSDKYKDHPNQVYGYCYAVPSGATDTCDLSLTKNRKAYYCIHNIINKVDLTPMVAPKEMGFKRYGVDHFVPGSDRGEVKSYVDYATKDNGSYKRTVFYDNESWWTNSSAYKAKRPSMLSQLALVNEEIFFVDWFKETDIITGKAEGIKSYIKGKLTESSPAKMEEVKGSTTTIESWLPDFYKTVQTYNSVGPNENLTRKSYSNTIVRAGKEKKLKKGEKNWYVKGVTAQDTFRGLVQMMLSKTPAEKANLGAAFSGLSNKLSTTKIAVLYEKLINSSTGWDYSNDRQQDYLDMFWNMLKDNSYGQKAIQDAISDPAELADLENYFPSLMSIVFRIVRQDFNDKKHSGKLRMAGTFAANTEAILQGHVPEIALAWLRSYDSYYDDEKSSYYWGQTSVEPGTVTLKINGQVVSDGSSFDGSQVLKLSSSNPSDAIYYRISDGSSEVSKSALLLYNDKQGIVLNAPSSGSKTYTIAAFPQNSSVPQAGKVVLQSRVAVDKNITIKPKNEEPAKVIHTEKLQKMRWNEANGEYEPDGSPVTINTGLVFKEYKRYDIFSIKEFMDKYDENYYPKTRYMWMRGSEGQNNYPYKLYPKIKKLIFESNVIDEMKPVASQPLKSDFGVTTKVKAVYATGANRDYVPEALFDSMKWEVATGEDEYSTVKSTVAEPNRKYRLVLEPYRYSKDGAKYFTDSVSVQYKEQGEGDPFYASYFPYEENSNTKIVLPNTGESYPATAKIKITKCEAEDAESWVWNKPDDVPGMILAGADALPKYAGTITAGAKTVSGMEIAWDASRYEKSGDAYNIRGLIKNDPGTKAAVFTGDDYDWDGRTPFEVEGTINVVSTNQLLPPTADVAGGDYTFVYDEIPVNDDGNMVVRLSDQNVGVSSNVFYKIGSGEFVAYDSTTGIVLNKPSEGTDATYSIKVKCTPKEGESGYTASDEIIYTYTLRNPKFYTVKAFVWDTNDTLTVDSLDENARYTEEVEAGDELMIDYDDLVGDDDQYFSDLVSWNKITGKDVSTKTLLPGRERTLWYEAEASDVYLMAETAPLLTDMEMTIDKPETGEGLPQIPEELKLTIGGEVYDIDTMKADVEWTASENSIDDGIAKSGTTYTATVSISSNNLSYYDPDEGVYHDLDLKFLEDYDTGLNVNGVTEDTASADADITDLYYTVETEEDGIVKGIHIDVTFKKSGAATFLMVEPPQGLSLAFDADHVNSRYESDVKPNLPVEAEVLVDDGSIRTLSVNWVENLNEEIYDEEGHLIYNVTDGVAYEEFGYVVTAEDLNGLDAWSLSMNGYVTLPDGMDYPKDEEGNPVNEDIVMEESGQVRCYFEYPVFMEGAPESNMPEILPSGGEYEPSTENLVVEFNTFPRSTNSQNRVDVYYKITYGKYNDEDNPSNEGEEDEEDYYSEICWYDEESGELKVDENANKYVPYDGDDGDEAETDLAIRTITRQEIGDNDYARVTAVAVENGAYKISPMAEAYYDFLDKYTAEIPDEILDDLNELEMTAGSTLQALTLPANCKWAPETDIYEVREGIAGEYVDAVVIYNDDPEKYNDLLIDVKILLTAGTYNIIADDCRVYLADDYYDEFSPEWPEVKEAETGSLIYVSANAAREGYALDSWLVTDSDGNELDYDYATGYDDKGQEITIYDAIIVTMPNKDMRVRPVWYEPGIATVPVESLTVDPSSVELKKGATATITATAIFQEADEYAQKPDITFTSSDPGIVSVTYKDGKATLTAVSSGSATIWVDCADKGATCYVSVGNVFTDLQLTDCKAYDTTGGTEQILKDSAVKGSTIKLVADEPKNATEEFKEWTINGADIDRTKNPAVFTVRTDIVARAEYGVKAEYEDKGEYDKKAVKVKKFTVTRTDPVSKKEKKVSSLYVDKNGLVSVNAAAVYDLKTAEKPDIVFRSSNTDVARVRTVKISEGRAYAQIVGCLAGKAVITAYCGNKTSKITVTVGDEEVTGIALFSERLENEKTDDGQYVLELNSGEQELIDLMLVPYDSVTEMKVKWKSDDKKVATVKNGLITAKMTDKGHTTVTATVQVRPYGQKKWTKLEPAKIVVRVKKIAVPKKSKLDKSYKISLKKTQNLDLNADKLKKKNVVSCNTIQARLSRIVGEDEKTFEWTSTNEDIVKITAQKIKPEPAAKGKKSILTADIQATGIGTAYVVLTGSDKNDPTKKNVAVMKVVVKATAPDLYFTQDSLGLMSDGCRSLEIKKGSYDKLFYTATTGNVDRGYNVTQKITVKGSGGVTMNNGVMYARKATKPGKPAKVTIKCGKSTAVLYVTVK